VRSPGPASESANLTTVEHLTELRQRIIGSVAALVVAFGLCFWQNHLLLAILNAPLPDGYRPITLSVTEPFMTSVTVSFYAAVILALPVILYQAYAFVLPALSPLQRREVTPALVAIPLLFMAGVAFGYVVVVPAALKFLLHFNAHEFDVQVRAHDYYGFASQTLAAMGLVFQVPVGIVAATRLEITTPAKLRASRRYAYLIIAVVAMLLPGTDPVTMLVEMLPLALLFELSIVLASVLGGRRQGALGRA
jgi:sec-independent protein translocase protein TatC